MNIPVASAGVVIFIICVLYIAINEIKKKKDKKNKEGK